MFRKSFALIKNFLLPQPAPPPVAPNPKAVWTASLSPEKQKKVDLLCEQLFRKKALVTSGKLQLIGLSKVRKRLGVRWPALSKVVYDTAEDVLAGHLDSKDLFLRYHDESYVILFARATREHAEETAKQISEEIRKRLFAVDEKELREIEVRQAISEIQAASLKNGSFTDFLNAFTTEDDDTPVETHTAQKAGKASVNEPEQAPEPAHEIGTAPPEPKKAAPNLDPAALSVLLSGMSYAYFPLWDVRRSALTTYLCLPYRKTDENPATAYRSIFDGQSPENIAAIDIATLKAVMAEVAAMEKDGRKLLIACPVQIETLSSFGLYEEYKKILQTIPQDHKQFLIFFVMNINENMPQKDPYWFATPLSAFCRHVFAEVPLRRDINFNYLKNSGIDVVGIRLDNTDLPEQSIISILNAFSIKAKSFHIPQTFVLGVSTLSLTTSAVCAGFSYLGGPAIHEQVPRPDTIHKYRYEDLLSHLMPET